ncbi:probable helicase with zinc finger domain [Patella vulgata]|uniref:probable helicase with zinc finger domain n=1 Tax=Patella vulgata TaxID=6465 RepID=UPI0024A99943|nr:probable helicase with zinc finger domain [Patella vulgata]XP_055954784.1 probable helicase with zinc finger domain [Patella vulgata]
MDEGELKNDSEVTNHVEVKREGDNVNYGNINLSEVIGKISGYVKQRKHNEALAECNKGLALEPHHEKLLEKKIKILCNLGQLNEAYTLALHWNKRQPQHPVANKELKRLQDVLASLQDQDSEEEPSVNSSKQDENHNAHDVSPSPSKNNRNVGDVKEDKLQTNSKKSTLVTSNANLSTINQHKSNGTSNGYECTFCDIKFKKKGELETHCRSDLHKKRLTSDEGQDWQFRPPPRGLSSEEYCLCQRFSENGRCTFGEKCTEAHSEEELNEWKERFKYRREQLQKAREKLLHGNSYTEKLMERLMLSENPSAILVQSMDFVKLHINSDLKVNMVNKRCTNAWTFTVTSKMCLHNVCLLDDVNKSYFCISSISVGPKKTQKYQNLENNCQEWTNQDVSVKAHGECVYRIKVVFKTDIFGTFRQSIVFDFGLETVLRREMEVDSAPVLDTGKLTNDLLIVEAARWTEEKVQIVAYQPKLQHHSATEKDLLAKYTLPRAEKYSTIMQTLSKENYRLWMHEMLYLEEMTQYSLISGFNVKTSLQLVNRFLLMPGALSTAKYAHNGELFAKMKLEDDLSEDSIGGRLILQNAQIAWIALCKSNSDKPPKKVYEVVIEDKGKNFIFLRLSKNCVDELKLSCDEEVCVVIQFQLNRLPKVEMHAAVDKLPTLDIVFPNLDTLQNIPWSPERQWNEELDCKLNVKQKEAILAITADTDIILPPLLLVGPFGTGKTYTLAQAVKQVLKNDGSRILICTHSNSAADLYIKDFFHPCFEEGDEDIKPLRILYQYRWVQTVSDVVLKYTLYDSSTGIFKHPTLEDLEKHRIIITTLSTARYISDINVSKEFFTHIFIDEAAQALECETLIPLSMACESTRIVLAGDHMQLSPEVSAEFCRQQGFHMSFLERLHEMYPRDHSCKVMLCENYRSHSAIVDFTSELFYENKLISSGKQKAHSKLYPLTFYAAKGEEVQHPNSTGFYNTAEVYEVVERVEDLQKKWLVDEWGPLDEDAISVVTPYTDQVKRIRAELRRKKLFRISVERVHNVQGKQYRAIILSTVRTQNTCRSDSREEDFIDYGFLSNVKLLNTAITRAQSLVMVVGDPVSLCLVGKCRKVWEYFLEICNKHGSLHGMTWTQLRAQLEGVEMTKTYTLNPLAPEFIPNRLYHITRAASETIGMNLHSQVPMPPWQHMSPYSVPGYNPATYPMYQHMMPYPYQGQYVPNMYNRVMYKQPSPPSTGGRASPKTTRSPSQLSPNSQKVRAEHNKDGIKNVEGKPFHKPARSRMMGYVPPRVLMAPHYSHYYPVVPHYPGFYYLPEDPRVAVYPNQYVPHRSMPHLIHHPGSERMYPQPLIGPNVAHKNNKSDTESDNSDARVSPSTNSGQQIQLLPNVKHIPGHLFTCGPQSTKGDASENNNLERANKGQKQQKEERRLNVSDRPYSPANYGMDRSSTPGLEELNTDLPPKPSPFSNNQGPFSQRKFHKSPGSDKQFAEKQETLKNRRSGKALHLRTGFSTQFDDDLPTPTEVKDIVQMLEDFHEEKSPCPLPIVSASKEIKTQTKTSKEKGAAASSTPPLKFQLNFTPPNNGEVQSSNNGGKLSYAGVLRKQPSNSLSPQPNADPLSGIEPQTPRTPSGFITPGGDMNIDPFGILKSLNIEPAPRHRSFQHF